MASGRVVESLDTNDTDEDRFAQRTMAEYGSFMHATPWYEFPFGRSLVRLWRTTPLWGRHPLRKWERKGALSAEYAIKALYGSLIRVGTKSTYGDEPEWTYAWVGGEDAGDAQVDVRATFTDRSRLVAIRRYEPFTAAVRNLVQHGGVMRDVAGNREILVTAITPPMTSLEQMKGRVLSDVPLLASPRRRVAVEINVSDLGQLFTTVQQAGIAVEHVYDY